MLRHPVFATRPGPMTARKAAAHAMDAKDQPVRRKRTGRPAGSISSKGRVLDAARAEFAAHGFNGTTTRAVAKSAGVDSALIHHFFLTKHGLFAVAIQDAFAVPDLLPTVLDGAPERCGERLVRAFVSHWEAAEMHLRVIAVLRSVVSSPAADEAVRGFLGAEVLLPVTKALGRKKPELRAALIGVQLLGLAVQRYLVGSEQVVALRAEQLVFSAADVCQRYLTGRL